VGVDESTRAAKQLMLDSLKVWVNVPAPDSRPVLQQRVARIDVPSPDRDITDIT
jgi:hypothetical protein